MNTILLGVVMFTTIILALVAIILIAKSKLVASGNVKITVNGGKKPSSPRRGQTPHGPGLPTNFSSLQPVGAEGPAPNAWSKFLRGAGIFAHGRTHINNRQAREGMRLSCQVAIKQNMTIEVPEEVFGVRKWTCKGAIQPQRGHLY